MAKLRDLTGKQIIRILQGFGFKVTRIKGSHHRMQRRVDDSEQSLSIPVHGNKSLAKGTVKGIYEDACDYIAEEDLRSHFYTD